MRNKYFDSVPYINQQKEAFDCLEIILEFCKYSNIKFDDYYKIIKKTSCCEDFSKQNLEKYYEKWNMKDTALNMYYQMFNYKEYYCYVKDKFSNNNINFCDYGCGSGLNSLNLYNKMKFKNMDLYDVENFSAKFIRHYIKEQNLNNVTWYNDLDEENIKKKKEYYDVIICSDVLEHLPNPTETLKKLHYMLKENGFLILSAPFELHNLAEHIIEAPIDFYETNNGYKFLKQKFERLHHFAWFANINGVYRKGKGQRKNLLKRFII